MTINKMIENIVKKYGIKSKEYIKFVKVANLALERKHWIANSFLKGMYDSLMEN